jgi:GDP-L-fucose synthase
MSETLFWKNKKILVTGGAGFIGKRVADKLVGDRQVDPANIIIPRSAQCDLRQFQNCLRIMKGCDIVIHLAAVTGGISFSRANPASQYYDSSIIDLNVIESACREGVEKMVTIGNLFAYSPEAPIPLTEADLFNGLPTDAHRGVGWMKRNLAVLADLYYKQYGFPMVVIYSANAYGPGDSLDMTTSHVIPATIFKCLRESKLVVWGDGSPTRDFLFVEDIAEALLLAVEKLEAPRYINIGSGNEVSIKELVGLIAQCCNFKGQIEFDTSQIGGDARRCTSIHLARKLLDFKPKTTLADGLQLTVNWYRDQLKS